MSLFLNGRTTVYTNEIAFESDILRSNIYKMVGDAKLAQTILASGLSNPILVSGTPCSPISPAGLGVTVGVGTIYAFSPLDETAYSVIPSDTNPNHELFKQGVNFDPIDLETPAPTVTGNTVIHLVQAIFKEEDENLVSRPYFNPSSTPQNPLPPIYQSNYDTRADLMGISLKQGVEGITPAPPAPDPGWTGLYYITVTFGQTSIVTADITEVPNAPFIKEGLTQKISQSVADSRYVQIQNYQKSSNIFSVAGGTSNAITAVTSPTYGAYAIPSIIQILATSTNTGATTLNINGIGTKNVNIMTIVGLKPLSGGEIRNGGIYNIVYDGNQFQILNPSTQPTQYAQITFGQSSTQTIPGGNINTKITPDNVFHDPNAWWDATNHRYVGMPAGRYRVTMITHGVFVPNDDMYQSVYLNGSLWARLCEVTGASKDLTLPGSVIVPISSNTDYIEFYANMSGASSLTIGADASNNGDTANNYEIEYIGN